MISIDEKLKKYMDRKNLKIIQVSTELAQGWCGTAKKLQVEAKKKIRDDKDFTKYDIEGISLYIHKELELTENIEIKYLYTIPMIWTVLSAKGIRIKK